MSGLHGLLVGHCASMRRRLRFELRLLARLRLLDRSRVRGDTALRAKLGLSFHLGALHGDARSIAIGFGACGRLSRTRAFGGFARARHRERATLRVGCSAKSGFVGHREGLRRARPGRRIEGVSGVRSHVVCDHFVGRAFALLTVAFDFAPYELGATYVM
jgi:hypothetical protein